MMLTILFQALMIILIISLPILVILVVIRALGRSIRGSREPFERDMRSLLGEIRKEQKETNRLLREHLAEDRSDTE
jgi:predicted Holliday junction resolvase-like endonuclease